MTINVKSPLEMFYHWEVNASDEVFLRQPVNGGWQEYTWSAFSNRVRRLSSFIHSLNLPEKSNIAILSSNLDGLAGSGFCDHVGRSCQRTALPSSG